MLHLQESKAASLSSQEAEELPHQLTYSNRGLQFIQQVLSHVSRNGSYTSKHNNK